MRIGKIAWLVLGIGILIIAAVTLYMVYSRQISQQEDLDASLSTAQSTLPKLVSERENLEGQLTQLKSGLAQAESSLSTAKKSFPESVESIEYGEILFQIADDSDLEITSLTSSEPSDETVEDITYWVTSFKVEVKGEVADILKFVNAIATGEDFTTATAEVVNIDIPEPLTEEEKEVLTEEEIEEEEMPSASIKLVIYSYEGG